MPHKRSIGTLVIVIAAMALLCLFVCYGGKILVKQVYDFINKIEEYKLPFNLNMDIKVINEKIVSGVVDNSPGYISGFTMVFTGVAVFIMATVFISGDMSSIRSSVKKNIFGKEIIYLGRRLKTVLGNYLNRAYNYGHNLCDLLRWIIYYEKSVCIAVRYCNWFR